MVDGFTFSVCTLFFGFCGGLPAEMFGGLKEKVRFSDPQKSVFGTWKSCLQNSSYTKVSGTKNKP
jgi:hypothetical protein